MDRFEPPHCRGRPPGRPAIRDVQPSMHKPVGANSVRPPSAMYKTDGRGRPSLQCSQNAALFALTKRLPCVKGGAELGSPQAWRGRRRDCKSLTIPHPLMRELPLHKGAQYSHALQQKISAQTRRGDLRSPAGEHCSPLQCSRNAALFAKKTLCRVVRGMPHRLARNCTKRLRTNL